MASGTPTLRKAIAVTWRPLATIVALLAIAELAKTLGLLPVFVPAPSQIVDEVMRRPALLTANIGPTAWKAASGYAISAAITVTAAAIAVSMRPLYSTVYNIGVTLHAIPIIATAPLVALWVGIGPQVQIAIAALASQFPMLVGTMQGLQASDARQRELMYVLSATRPQMLRYLLIPSALPYLFAGFKIAAPSAVLGTITAEWAGADQGIGAMMLYALFAYDTPKVWLSVILTCFLAASGYGIWALIERIVIYWDRDVEIAE
jgi:ABC-type nitrate/sulfonate/bicarbonate transport system permease component